VSYREALDRSRAQFAWKCGRLDAAALIKPFPPSAMTLGGLVKHMAAVEERYTMEFLTGEIAGAPWSTADWHADPEWDWHSAAEDSPDELYRLWRDAVERSVAYVDDGRRGGSRSSRAQRTRNCEPCAYRGRLRRG
jgi:hypothetical protein